MTTKEVHSFDFFFEGTHNEMITSEKFGIEYDNVFVPREVKTIQVYESFSGWVKRIDLNDYVSWLKKMDFIDEFSPLSESDPYGSFTYSFIDEEISREPQMSEHNFGELFDMGFLYPQMIADYLGTNPECEVEMILENK